MSACLDSLEYWTIQDFLQPMFINDQLMNTKTILAGVVWAQACLGSTVAQITIPSDGSDGALIVAAGEIKVIHLDQAITGGWDTNNVAHAGQGVYDPAKWAVVFKYSSMDIQGTVTFSNHPSRAPVVWLVQGDVKISGVVNLSGQAPFMDTDALVAVEPGPGGFRGGPAGPQGGGFGMGPGGGGPGQRFGVYATSYGNPQIVPLIGGSGGVGSSSSTIIGGGAGGGAILIASRGEIELNGAILALGSAGTYPVLGLGIYGSGGAVRLIASKVTGTGRINAHADGAASETRADGRIRIEAAELSEDLTLVPETIAVVPANPPIIWPPDSAPAVRVLRVDGVDSPAEPTAPLRRVADISLQNDKPVEVILESTNFPLEGIVELRVAHKFAGGAGWLHATYVSGDFSRALWKVNRQFPGGFSVLQARATLP
ncbi:MAG: hypothetical protein KIT22_03370 [Verrucomicrobiae bacterium]|nr:hypothetical protein [Verrucomicrobiae bacterium]